MTKDSPTVLVTGGCGYIGSHTIVCLLEKDYNVVVVDNLSNSSAISLDRVAEIVGLKDDERKERLVFYQVDLCNEAELRKVFESSPKFLSCIHFAGLKVGCYESVNPEGYRQVKSVVSTVLLPLLRPLERALAFPFATTKTTWLVHLTWSD